MFKDMTDEELAQAIVATRNVLANNVAMRRKAGTARLIRDLDIAVAIKRQRQRAGTWTGPATV